MRKLRLKNGLSQPAFAAKCQRLGWDLSRDTLAKIELQTRWVADFEVVFLAQALNVPHSLLLPDHNRMKSKAREFVRRLEVKVS